MQRGLTQFQVKMKLELVSEGKCFAFLAGDLHSDMQLAEVRARLKDEAEELMPSSYQFLYRNIPLSEKQESLLTLRLCWEQPNAAKDIFVLHFSETNTTPEKPVLDTWLKATKSSYVPEETEINKKTRVNKCLNPSKIKLDIFTDEEIFGQCCWLERERRKYWNCKVNELRVSKEVANYGKTELIGVLDTAWTLKKAELLQIRASQLQVMHERLKTVYSHEYQSFKKKSNHPLTESTKIHHNMEILSKTLFFIQNENRCLSSETSKANKLQAEERLHKYLFELKRVSDALFKALSQQEKRLIKFQEDNIGEPRAEWCDGKVLSVAEENDLAVEVKHETTMSVQ